MSDSEEERRPRPIGVADDSEDSDVERGNDTSAGASVRTGDAPAIETTGEAAPDEGKAKKPSKKMPAFSENDLVKDKGLRQIYKEFPRKCRYKGKGREAEFLRGLMVAYKEWGYQLYPGVAFEDLASRTEKLGGRARTRDLMRELRDTERDRVIEAKYGRAAVEDVRAQEAAKIAAKESKTAAAEGEAAEEREDEELAGSRYMEVDEGTAAPAAPAAGSEAASAAVISEQVRQRMEVNRRLALERLRKKKEEAAAAALQKDSGHGAAGTAAIPPGDNCSGEIMDPMDVDEGGAEATVDDVDDDEAAEADIEAETEAEVEVRAEQTVTATGAAKSADAAASAVVSTPLEPTPSADGDGATGIALSDKTKLEATASAKSTTRREDEAVVDANRRDSIDVADDFAADGGVDQRGEGAAGKSVEHDGSGGVSDIAPKATLGEEARSDTSPASCSGETATPDPVSREDRGHPQDKASETAGGSTTLGDLAAGDVNDNGDRAAGAGSPRRDEHATFSSPVKCKAGGGLPLSPLGNLFASTDVSAEGGTAAARAPLAGLFSAENA
ncbi:unnamed protein product [Hapterophycus canaliculatus]